MNICGSWNLVRTLTAFSVLVAASAFSQNGCNPESICFEPGEAKLERPEDIARFVADHHEKLGLTGRETFRCSIEGWLTQSSGGQPPNRPQYSYNCQQLSVRGMPTKYLSMRVGFWSRDGDVASVRCRCVREDVRLPSPKVTRAQAEERGLRYFYARLPEVAPQSIRVVDSQDPVIQWDLKRNEFRLVRNVLYRFPMPATRFVRTQDVAEVTVSVDAVDKSVLRAVGAQLYFFRSGITQEEIDEMDATLAAMPFGDEQFDAAQGYLAFRLHGEAEASLMEQRLRSRARWEPDTRGVFTALFADATPVGDLATFLEDHGLLMLEAGFHYMYGGQLRHGEFPAQTSGGDAPAVAIRNAFERARAQAERQTAYLRAEPAHVPEEFVGLTQPADLRFFSVTFQMRHADALRLYEKEQGRRLLTVWPIDPLLETDVGVDRL